MYLSELKIWNFRKFGSSDDGKAPGLSLELKKGFNLLVGENDSGKTCIIDAIKFLLLTESHEFYRIQYEDFHLKNEKYESKRRTKELKIECIFRGFENKEASHFLKWAGIENDDSGKAQYYLKVWLEAKRDNRKIYVDFKAGADDEGKKLSREARDLLRVVYLKPLRDAENELRSGRNSRLSKVLDSHKAFEEKEEHKIMEIVKNANKEIENYFTGTKTKDKSGKEILDSINNYLEVFSNNNNLLNSDVSIAEMDLKSILEKLNLSLSENKVGLGSENLLFIAVEFLLLQRVNYTGLKLALIEEIEAHLHPQAQLRLVEYLQRETGNLGVQLLLTSHSPILASTIKLKNLIIIKNGEAFPMGRKYTKLLKGDYLFLERFLNSTKSNLFFAQGVILVEGDAENLLIPTIANIIDLQLSKYGVSIVNVGSTAFLRYSKIFQRKHENRMKIPVACITDCDIKPDNFLEEKKLDFGKDEEYKFAVKEKIKEKQERYDGQGVKTYVSPDWTLEYVLALSGLIVEFYKAVLYAKKIQNSDKYVLTDEKEKECDNEVEKKLKKWETENWSSERIAYEVYNNILLDKNISKAITAQCFAKLLNDLDKEEIKRRIFSDKKLKYIIDALKYVCNQGEDND